MSEEVKPTEVNPVVQQNANPAKPNPTEVLRKLSKEFSIDLFNESGVDSLVESYKAKESAYSTAKTKAETLEKDLQAFAQKENDYKVKIEALGMGFSSANLDEVLALAKVNIKDGQSISDGLKVVKEKYAKTFITQSNVGLIHNGAGNNPDLARTEQERYLLKDPKYKYWDKIKNPK